MALMPGLISPSLVPFSRVNSKGDREDFFTALPLNQKFDVIEFLDQYNLLVFSRLNRDCVALAQKAPSRYSKDFAILKDARECAARPPKIEDWKRFHQVTLSPFTEKEYRDLVILNLHSPYVNVLDVAIISSPGDRFKEFTPIAFTATIDCSMSVRKRFVRALMTDNHLHLTTTLASIYAEIFCESKPDAEISYSALPEYTQAYVDKRLTLPNLETQSVLGEDGDFRENRGYFMSISTEEWFGYNYSEKENLWKAGKPFPLMIENAFVSRIQVIAAERDKSFKLELFFNFDRENCFPPKRFVEPLLDKLAAIAGVELQGHFDLE